MLRITNHCSAIFLAVLVSASKILSVILFGLNLNKNHDEKVYIPFGAVCRCFWCIGAIKNRAG
jgi:hypothetical protein